MAERSFTQYGTFSMAVLIPVLIFIIVLLFFIGIEEPMTTIILSFVILTFIVCLLTFYKLTIIIDETHLSFIMGIGLIRKTFLLSEIESCSAVTNPALWGIGIRLTPAGWLYNVSGFNAIELRFRGKKKVVRIGTDRSGEITKVVNEKIGRRMSGSSLEEGGNSGLYLILTLLAAAIIIPIILVIYGSRDPEVIANGKSLTIEGMYGLTINYSDIVDSDTLQALPAIRSRTNGFASGKILKGHFRLNDKSNIMLFVTRDTPPYIIIKTTNKTICLNFENPEQTRKIFENIETGMSDQNKGR